MEDVDDTAPTDPLLVIILKMIADGDLVHDEADLPALLLALDRVGCIRTELEGYDEG